MLIGIPKEIKNHEARVGMTPYGVMELIQHGHKVLVQTQAGLAVGFTDEQYLQAGAMITENADTIFDQAELIVKVNEPQPIECTILRKGQILFTYLHLASNPAIARMLLNSGVVAIGYETVTDGHEHLPLLVPTSEVAGRMAVLAGAHALERSQGGRGVLLGGVPGVAPGKVVILGGGVVGLNAARTALGLGADTIILDKSLPRLQEIDMILGHRIKTLLANAGNIEDAIHSADVVVGAVLIPGAATPKLITRSMLKGMKPGSVLVDVAIDQGGCFETSRPTTPQEPTYVVDGVVHYCVANMPAGVARTATLALTNATLPYILTLADDGWRIAMQKDNGLRCGLNICGGEIMHPTVAEALDQPCGSTTIAIQS